MLEAGAYIALFLIVICANAFFSKVLIGGDDGKASGIVEASFSIGILYILLCAIIATNTCPDGVPFVYQLQTYAGLNDFFKKNHGGFFVECAKLVLLTLIVEKIYSLLKKEDETSSAALKGIRVSLFSVVAGIIVNSFIYTFLSKSVIGKYGFEIFSCVVGGMGVATVLIPKKISTILHVDNHVAEFICKELPQTDLWKDLKNATLNSVLCVFFLMYVEREYGSLARLGSSYISAILPPLMFLILLILGIKLAIASILGGKKDK